MAMAAEVITGILVVILLVATAFAMVAGILGGVFGEGFERCGRCGHLTLGIRGHAHPKGCPDTLPGHLVHVVHSAFHDVHLRHHG
jgi:hypothetical protein